MKSWPALDVEFPDNSELPDRVLAAILDFRVAVDEGALDATPLVWRVYFPDAARRDAATALLHEAFGRERLGIRPVDVEDEDWAARSQASLLAVQVGDIVIAPPWGVSDPGRLKRAPTTELASTNERAAAGAGFSRPITIVIQPSMGFGTGHHATTRLCLAALQRLDLDRRTVIDVGTGSGVLAIAAKRLGAAQVLAIDDDPDAVEAARTNLRLNPDVDVTLGVIDVRAVALRPFDVVIANLTGALLISTAGTLQRLSSGRLILSGFLLTEEQDVRAAFDKCALESRTQEEEWGCLTLSVGT